VQPNLSIVDAEASRNTKLQKHKRFVQSYSALDTDKGCEKFKTVLDLTKEVTGHIPSRHCRYWSEYDKLQMALARYPPLPPIDNDTATDQQAADNEYHANMEQQKTATRKNFSSLITVGNESSIDIRENHVAIHQQVENEETKSAVEGWEVAIDANLTASNTVSNESAPERPDTITIVNDDAVEGNPEHLDAAIASPIPQSLGEPSTAEQIVPATERSSSVHDQAQPLSTSVLDAIEVSSVEFVDDSEIDDSGLSTPEELENDPVTDNHSSPTIVSAELSPIALYTTANVGTLEAECDPCTLDICESEAGNDTSIINKAHPTPGEHVEPKHALITDGPGSAVIDVVQSCENTQDSSSLASQDVVASLTDAPVDELSITSKPTDAEMVDAPYSMASSLAQSNQTAQGALSTAHFFSAPPPEGLVDKRPITSKAIDAEMADAPANMAHDSTMTSLALQIAPTAVQWFSVPPTETPVGELLTDPREEPEEDGMDIYNQFMDSWEANSTSEDEAISDGIASKDEAISDEPKSDDGTLWDTAWPQNQAFPSRSEPLMPLMKMSTLQEPNLPLTPGPMVSRMMRQQQQVFASRFDAILPFKRTPVLQEQYFSPQSHATVCNVNMMEPHQTFATRPNSAAPIVNMEGAPEAEQTTSVSEPLQSVSASPVQVGQTLSVSQQQESNLRQETQPMLIDSALATANSAQPAQNSSVVGEQEQDLAPRKQKRPSARAVAPIDRQVEMKEADSPAPVTTSSENTLVPFGVPRGEPSIVSSTEDDKPQKELGSKEGRKGNSEARSTLQKHASGARALLTEIIAAYRNRHPKNYFNIPDSQVESIFRIMLELDRKQPPDYLEFRLKQYLVDVKTGASSDWQKWVSTSMRTLHVRDVQPALSYNNSYVPNSDRLDAVRQIFLAMDEANFSLANTEGRFMTYEDMKDRARQEELSIHDKNTGDGARFYRKKVSNPVARWNKAKEKVRTFCDDKYGKEKLSTLQPSITEKRKKSTTQQQPEQHEHFKGQNGILAAASVTKRQRAE
jgi:hypothetical protein